MFSRVGLGAGSLGDARLTDADAARLVHGALDLGVTVFDTARSYGASEDRLGRALAGRGRDALVFTKGGYGVDGVADWTGEVIRRGVDEARRRLRRDRLDGFFLHSCGVDVLERGEVVDALLEARASGKVRLTGYSGEGAALAWAAARRDTFSALELSLSPFDQRNRGLVAAAEHDSFAVFAKRPLGNAPWRYGSRPEREDEAIYWDRMRAMAFDPGPRGWAETAIRFAAFQPGVTTALVGTASLEHLASAVRAAAEGPLPPVDAAALLSAFDRHGAAWAGVIGSLGTRPPRPKRVRASRPASCSRRRMSSWAPAAAAAAAPRPPRTPD